MLLCALAFLSRSEGHLLRDPHRRVQYGNGYACIINGINYCQPPELNVPSGVVASPSPASSPVQPSTTMQPIDTPAPTITSYPTAWPTANGTRRPTNIPTLRPTISPEPSDQPSAGPTDAPSSSPTSSQVPSKAPTAAPTISPKPSPVPSRQPSATPSAVPSPAPTTTAAPTFSGYDTKIEIGDDGFPQPVSTCRKDLPSWATVTNQLITFEYVMNVAPDSSVPLSVSTITMRLQDALSTRYLSCDFSDDTPIFYTYAVSSRPGDELSDKGCSSDQRYESNECYVVNGAFTVKIFNSDDSTNARRLTETSNSTIITDEVVYQSFTTSLHNIFDSGVFDSQQIQSTTFIGVTNSEVSSSSNKSQAGVVAGSVFGVLIVVAAVSVLAFFGVGFLKKRQPYAEELDDQFSLSLYEDQSDRISLEREFRTTHDNDEIEVEEYDYEHNDSDDQTEQWQAPKVAESYSRPPRPASEEDALDRLVAMSMMSKIKEDLGPKTQPATPRRYDVRDTVDL